MKYNKIYSAPETELVRVVSEQNFLVSGLEDYGDNPIFGAPGINNVQEVLL